MTKHDATATNFSTLIVGETDWRGSCGQCGWAATPGWGTPNRKARTREQAERQAERHNRVAAEREHITSRLLHTVLSPEKRTELHERLRRLR